MHAEDAPHPVALQHAGLAELFSAAGGLLRGLEQEQNVPGQLRKVGGGILRQSEHHGGVPVVSAGVHHAGVNGGKGEIRLLLYRQGVQIRPESHGIPLSGVKVDAHAPGDGSEDFPAQRLQNGLDIFHRLRQPVVQFRDPVQVPTVLHARHCIRPPRSRVVISLLS